MAAVTDTRIKLHKVKTAQTECREIFCVYELDGHEQWHSLRSTVVAREVSDDLEAMSESSTVFLSE